jgi:hypothetical protein
VRAEVRDPKIRDYLINRAERIQRATRQGR